MWGRLIMGSLFSKKPKIATNGDLAEESFATTINQFGPGFRTESGRNPDGSRFQRFVETGDQARLTDARGDIALGLAPLASTLTSQIATGYGNPGTRQDIEQATFDRASNLLAPLLERRERSVRGNLANTGNPIGSERASFELDQLNRDRSTALNDLALGAVLAGNQARGQEIAQQSALIDNDSRRLGQVGNIFSILQADRPQYFQAGQLLSPELVLNRSLGKAGLKQSRNAGLDNLAAGAISGGARVASAGMAG